MKEIKIYEHYSKTLKIVLGSLLFVVLGCFMVINTEQDLEEQFYYEIVGWVGIAFFGLGIILGTYKLIANKPHIILNNLGMWKAKSVFSTYKEKDVIEWNEIKNISLEKNETYIYVETNEDLLEIELKNTKIKATQLAQIIDKQIKLA